MSQCLLFSNRCDDIQNTRFPETIYHDLRAGSKWLPSRNKPVYALCIEHCNRYINSSTSCTETDFIWFGHHWHVMNDWQRYMYVVVGVCLCSKMELLQRWCCAFSINEQNSGVVCPQKQAKIARAGWVLWSFRPVLFSSRMNFCMCSTLWSLRLTSDYRYTKDPSHTGMRSLGLAFSDYLRSQKFAYMSVKQQEHDSCHHYV